MPAPLDRLMPIDGIDDWAMRIRRTDAFWDREVLDRPVVNIAIPRRPPAVPWPAVKTHASLRERWTDAEYQAEWARARALNTEYLGDALPTAFPNLGPEVFSAFFGAELEFSETTSWSVPALDDWDRAEALAFSKDGFFWAKLLEMTDAYLRAGRGVFYTGITDLHPGADAIASFRDPMRLNEDMIERPEKVKALLARVNAAYFETFDFYHEKLAAAGQAISNWVRIATSRKYYVPSNDFSCMISKAMFDEVFLPGLIEECRHMEANIYHLDGPGAIRHLDSLLEIKELNAIQWIYGAGNGPTLRWLDLHKRIQDAGKAQQILAVSPSDLDTLMEHLRPEGLWLDLEGVGTREEAEAVLRAAARWPSRARS